MPVAVKIICSKTNCIPFNLEKRSLLKYNLSALRSRHILIGFVFISDHRGGLMVPQTNIKRTDSTTELLPLGPHKEVEYFFASDAR